MGKKDKSNDISIISKISVICVLLVFAIFGYFVINKPKNIEKKTFFSSKESQIKLKLMKKIQDIWSGNSDFVCEKYKNLAGVNTEFYNCNPYILDCFLSSNENIIIDNEKISSIKNRKSYIQYDRRKNPIVTFKYKSKHFKVKLLNTCSDTYLPERKYSAGPKGVNLIWDNIGQEIFIDKNYVSNLDIFLWNGTTNNNLFRPSSNLTIENQIKYCQSKGKQLLESRYFDAASFFVGTLDTNPEYIYKFPYPWSRKSRLKFEEPKSRDCANIYSRECESIRPYEFFEPLATTWIGINKALGSYPEVFVNKFLPRANLKVSSFYLPYTSKWHAVGFRSYFDGVKTDLIETYTKEIIDRDRVEDIGVAFRCMLNR